MVAERGEYKGKPILKLSRKEDDKWPFSFGLTKAKLILEHIEDIEKFVKESDDGDSKD